MKVMDITPKNNWKVITASYLLVTLAVLGYLLEFIRGSRSLGYVLFISICVFLPVIIATVFYKMDRYINQFKYIGLYSFMISWMIMLIFSPKVIQYVLIFPLLMIYMLYFDVKLMRTASIIMIIFGAFKVFLNIYYYEMTDEFISTEYSVFVLSLIVFGAITVSTTSFSDKIHKNQLADIEDEKAKNELMLKEIISVLDVMSETSHKVSDIYDELIVTSNEGVETITVLNDSIIGISNNLVSQSANTERIHNRLLKTNELSEAVVEHTDLTVRSIDTGQETINQLDISAQMVQDNNEDVHQKMLELKESASEIKVIIDIIRNISEKTNLLALNASIESARAGEAGKGFAVVADAIRDLSLQTGNALENINTLVGNLEENAEQSLAAADASKSAGSTQVELIHNSKSVFDVVNDAIKHVDLSIKSSSEMTHDIVDGNQEVVNSISEITALVEDATRRAETVTEIVTNNSDLTQKAKSYMTQLDEVMVTIEKYM